MKLGILILKIVRCNGKVIFEFQKLLFDFESSYLNSENYNLNLKIVISNSRNII